MLGWNRCVNDKRPVPNHVSSLNTDINFAAFAKSHSPINCKSKLAAVQSESADARSIRSAVPIHRQKHKCPTF